MNGARSSLLCLALAVGSAPGGVQGTPQGIIAEVPIAVELNKTIIPVTAGGSSLRLILDSGHGHDGILIFHEEKIDTKAFGPAMAAVIEGAGAGPGSRALLFESAAFAIGAVRFSNQRAIVLANDAFKGSPSDGVIGHSLLGHYAVELDYDRNVMTLHDSATFRVKPGWESLPLTFRGNRIPWVDIEVATAGERPVKLAAYIDNASSEALELLTRESNRFCVPAVLAPRYLGRGLSGDIHGQEGTLARLRLGSHELTNVVAAVVPAATRSKQDGADAVLANDALRRFNVIFDYAHSRLHIRPNSHFREPFAGRGVGRGRN